MIVRWITVGCLVAMLAACLPVGTAGCAMIVTGRDMHVSVTTTKQANALAISVGDGLPADATTGPNVAPQTQPALPAGRQVTRAAASQPSVSPDRPSMVQQFFTGIANLVGIVVGAL